MHVCQQIKNVDLLPQSAGKAVSPFVGSSGQHTVTWLSLQQQREQPHDEAVFKKFLCQQLECFNGIPVSDKFAFQHPGRVLHPTTPPPTTTITYL